MEPVSMPNLVYQLCLLAQGFEAMGNHFQSNGGNNSQSALLFFGGVVLVVIALIVASRLANPTGPHRSPRRLFRELCAVHELTRKERKLLRRLARRRYEPPQAAFVQPDFFRLPEAETDEPDPLREQVTALGRKLYGNALPAS